MASNAPEAKDLQNLTRKQLLELERKKKTRFQLWMDLVIWLLPFVGGLVAVLEYKLIPDNSRNARRIIATDRLLPMDTPPLPQTHQAMPAIIVTKK